MCLNSKLVSVVMSVYNEKKIWVIEAIESILEQTYENIEFIIILDNPENKELFLLIKEYEENVKNIKMIINKKILVWLRP